MSLARRSLQVLAFICTLIVGVASMAVIVTQTAWFKEWLRGFIVRQAADYLNGRLSIGRLDGNLFFGVELEDIDLTMDGRTVVEVKDVGLDYNAFTFIGGHVALDDIRLNQPIVRLERTADGWNITRLVKARTPDPDEPKSRRPLEIGEIGVTDGALELAGEPVGTAGVEMPARVERLNASIGVTSDEETLDVTIAHVSLRAHEPALGLNDLSGRIVRTANKLHFENVALRTEESSLRVDGTLHDIEDGTRAVDVRVTSDRLTVDEIARIVPALRGLELQPAFEVTAKGPVDRMAVTLNVRERTVGTVRGDLTVDALEPGQRIAGRVEMAHVNVGPIAKSDTLKSDITGRARVDLALPSGRLPLSGTYRVDASHARIAGYEARDITAAGRIDGPTIRFDARAAAYGGWATAAGTVTTGTPLALDIRGQAADVDLRNLPPQVGAPRVASNLDLDYHVAGKGRVVSGDVLLRTSTLAGATIASGTTGQFTVGAGAPRYAAKGAVSELDIQQAGRGFGIGALDADRYKSRVNATFAVRGSGGGANPLELEASGSLTESALFGATIPRMDLETTVAGADLQVRAIGQFSGLDPAVVTGNARVKGEVAGAVDVNATLLNYRAGVTPGSVNARGRINLGTSSVAGVTIDSVVVDGHFADRAGQINQLSVTGPDVTLHGQGALALNETGASNMQVHFESPSLDRIGTIVGQPFKGAALVDATLTGNARALRAAGTLKGSNIGYADNEALNLDTTFSVAVPDLTPGRSIVQAESRATFLEIGGQRITELTANTRYTSQELEFDVTAQEGVRSMGAGGSMVFHPDHQEIHLANLTLRAENVEWRTPPGSEAAVQYGSDRIVVENVRLVNGDQRIEADGVIGSSEEPLTVRVENVDVAQLDELLLTDYGVAGRLDAAGTVAGPRDALRADGSFTLSPGAFRQFTFEALTGKVEYSGKGVSLDVRLQQNPQAWLTAKGFAPTSLFRATRAEERGRAGDPVDVRIETSQIDLGIVQGFTQYVTGAQGTLQANIRVEGTGYDPQASGFVDIKGGAFAVPDLGTSYTGLDTRIDLEPEAIQIRQFKILDSRGFPMTIGGSLGVDARRVEGVDIRITAENFEVIDNELADVKLDTNLRVTGTPSEPRVEGQVEIENGTIQVAEVIERTSADPYATEATEIAPNAPEGPVAATPTVFSALDLNVALSIPSNLVVRGSDLRPADAPISLGDVNVTVGGLVQLRKPRGEGLVRITGEMNTVRGTYDFQGRRFELLRDGRIRFTGDGEINPLLDFQARREISGVETFIRVQGTLRQPELAFSSRPPLEEADILALIVFNAPLNELGEGQQISLAQRATALAGGYLASGLARSIGGALELDQFEIQAQGDGGAPTLTIGEQVGERLFFRVRQSFGTSQGTEFILEYQIADYLRLQGSIAETAGGNQRLMFRRVERGGLDLIFFFSY
ncbi:MAG: translocation/assembly module TamB domain-containing protein [Vicinamibacterales bacterium]